MHIAQCLTHSDIGGGQQVVYTLVRHLRRSRPGVRHTVILPAGGVYVGRFAALGIPVVTLPLDRLSPMSVYDGIRIATSLDVDIIHSHGKGAGFYMRWFPRRLFGGRRVHSFHGFHPPAEGIPRAWYLRMERYLLRHTDAVIAVSESESRELRQLFPAVKTRCVAIPNAVDCDSFKASPAELPPRAILDFLETHRARAIVTMIGRNDPVKNHPLAYAAARIALGQRDDFAFLFIGVPEPDPVFNTLRSSFPDLVMAVESLPSVADVLRRSTVLLLTSRKEGCPLVILEARCAGVPAIGTRVDGIIDLIHEERDGLLCDETPDSIAAAIIRLREEPGLHDRLLKTITEDRSLKNPDAWSNEYFALYSSL